MISKWVLASRTSYRNMLIAPLHLLDDHPATNCLQLLASCRVFLHPLDIIAET